MGTEEVDSAFVVHGEPEASRRLAGRLRDLGAPKVLLPDRAVPYDV
jgi:hypothetical protein